MSRVERGIGGVLLIILGWVLHVRITLNVTPVFVFQGFDLGFMVVAIFYAAAGSLLILR
jgi:hypothetical protein